MASFAPPLHSEPASTDSAIFGAWTWDETYGGLAGAHQTPRSSNYSMELDIASNHTYRLVERDSVNAYLRCAGRLSIDPVDEPYAEIERVGRAFAYLKFQGWERQDSSYLACIRGHDTLYIYPGARVVSAAGTRVMSVADALVKRYVRLGGDSTRFGPRALKPRTERPPRLASGGFGYGFEYPDSFIRWYRLTRGFRGLSDRFHPNFPKNYPYRHDQTPFAVTGDFDGDGIYDVAMVGDADGSKELIAILDWNRAGKLVVLDRERPTSGSGTPWAYLELIRRGSSIGSLRLANDAILATYSDGSRRLHLWYGDRFRSAPVPR